VLSTPVGARTVADVLLLMNPVVMLTPKIIIPMVRLILVYIKLTPLIGLLAVLGRLPVILILI